MCTPQTTFPLPQKGEASREAGGSHLSSSWVLLTHMLHGALPGWDTDSGSSVPNSGLFRTAVSGEKLVPALP